MSNILLVVTIGICIGCMIYGYIKGFIKIVISLVAVMATAILVATFTPTVTELIVEYTPLNEAIELKFQSAMFGDDIYLSDSSTGEDLSLIEQISLIEGADIPDFLKEAALDNNNDEIYEQLGVSTFSEYIGRYLAGWVINVIAYIVTFLIVWAVVNLLVFSLDVVAGLPVLHGINRAVGTVLGLGFALVIVWIGFLGISLMYSSEIGQMCYAWIDESTLLTYLYNVNPILKMLL